MRRRRIVGSMLTVVETSLFQKQWPRYWTEDERGEFAAIIAQDPEAGVVGTGKSGGVRVIYFTRIAEEEIVLLTLYAKSKTDNLTEAKLKEIRRAVKD